MNHIVIVGIASGDLRAMAIDSPEQSEDAAQALIRNWISEGLDRQDYVVKVLSRVEGGTVYREG